jgi:CheY-like chemotaxis protein
LPIVMISGHGNIETAVSAIKRGAYDFIEKPFKADRLLLVAERALENSRLKREVRELKQLGSARHDHGRPFARRQPAAADDRESGADQQPHPHRRPVGQRQGAGRAHHSQPSARADGPFVVINAAAITPEHMESSCSASRRQRHAKPQGRRARRGAWRHAVHRRNRRHAARDAKQDFARAGRSDLPARRRQHQGHGRRAHRLLDQPQHRGRYRRRKIPRGSLSPALGGADPRAGARRAARGYSRTRRIFHDADFADHRAAEAHRRRRRARGAAIARLAGQRAAAAQQRRAADDPRRRRSGRGDHRLDAAAGRRLDDPERCRTAMAASI